MKLLGMDVGTTHCKVGLFAEDGTPLRIVSQAMIAMRSSAGCFYYDPEDLWQRVASAIGEVMADVLPQEVAGIGIASMAETGLLIDRKSGKLRSMFLPWFDTSAAELAEKIRDRLDPNDEEERFCRTGIRPTFKCSLAKLLWLREQDAQILKGATWLSVADYIAYRLTGEIATDYSLAGRTYVFRIDQKRWDETWLGGWNLSPKLFPDVGESSSPVGRINSGDYLQIGLAKGIPVCISGHDHLCAAFAVGAIRPGSVFDSMGTAETLTGSMEERLLERKEFLSGLSYGCHVIKDLTYWMGGISASGGSVEWLRTILGEPPLSYEELEQILNRVSSSPGEILYFPHLTGRGSPKTDPRARGAFVGLKASHGRADLIKAVLEGTAYEMETIRRAAEQVTGSAINPILVTGGGTRNRHWMQIKADVSGCELAVPAIPEASLLGAALVAGVGCGVYSNPNEAVSALMAKELEYYTPNADRHEVYQRIYDQGYLPLHEPLRLYYQELDDEGNS